MRVIYVEPDLHRRTGTWISGEQVFKYTAAGAVSPAQITLTANLQNVTMGKWQYKNSSGNWTDYPTTSDNAIITAEDDPDDELLPETMEIHYDVPGSARKALASAISEIIGAYPSYQAAPSFAYIIGEYTLDRNGVLTGPRNSQLMLTLDQDGYRTK